MYTESTAIDKIGDIDIIKRQNTFNAAYEFILQKDGQTLKDEKNVPHIYFSLSIARANARKLNQTANQ